MTIINHLILKGNTTVINKAIIEGRLGQAIELRTTPQGKLVTNFRLATERQWNGADGTPFTATDWHTVVAWEGLAEQCKDMHEGDVVYVEGRLQTRSWEDREHADVKHYRTEIIASVIRPVEAGAAVGEADAVAEMV
jgi:single-strand DNA-binding protein